VTGRRGRRRKQLLDDLKEKRRYWKLKQETLDLTRCRSFCERGYETVLREIAELLLLLLLYFYHLMHDIYNYVPETNRVSMVYTFVAVLCLQFR
jgi:ABC-type arginine transport system permease subunit